MSDKKIPEPMKECPSPKYDKCIGEGCACFVKLAGQQMGTLEPQRVITGMCGLAAACIIMSTLSQQLSAQKVQLPPALFQRG